MNILDTPIKVLDRLINTILADDMQSQSSLADLHGKCLQLHIKDKGINIFAVITSSGINLFPDHEGEADVVITGTLSEIISFMLSSASTNTRKSNLEVAGDIGLAQDFQNIVKNVDIDLEEYLSMYTGDYVAHKLGNLCKSASGYAKYASDKIRQDIGEYLIYEKNLVLSNVEVNEFISSIDILRDDVERLKQRVERLSDNRRG